MNLKNYKEVGFPEIAEIELSKKDNIYPEGTIIIQLHATKGQCFYLDKPQEVEHKYAVITAKNIDKKYLYYVFKNVLPNFLNKYQSDINIQPEVFKYLKLRVHSEPETQKHIAKILSNIDEQIDKEETLINEIKDLKKSHLEKMFI